MTLDTACSSSLVAVHLAVQGLRGRSVPHGARRRRERDPVAEDDDDLSRAQMMAADGRCKTFDAQRRRLRARRGLRRGRAEAARATPWPTATGPRRHPRLGREPGRAQQRAHRAQRAGAGGGDPGGAGRRRRRPADVGYVEAHGTGTALGDPIEVRALGAVFGPGALPSDRLLVGSVKTNIGHLEAAAGIAGLLKVVLALQHGEIPPQLHLAEPEPVHPVDDAADRRPDGADAVGAGQRPRIAGVSSFGFSGTNAHVILEEAPVAEAPAAGPDRPCHVLALSARTEPALRETARRPASHLESDDIGGFADIAFTANVGRATLSHRLALVAGGVPDAVATLRAYERGERPQALAAGPARPVRTEGWPSCSRATARSTPAWGGRCSRTTRRSVRRSNGARSSSGRSWTNPSSRCCTATARRPLAPPSMT